MAHVYNHAMRVHHLIFNFKDVDFIIFNLLKSRFLSTGMAFSNPYLKKSIAILLIKSGLSSKTSCVVFGKTQY